MRIRVYVANLHAYNCGALVGEWIDLPMDEDELRDRIQRIVAAYPGGEEVAIHDYEAPFRIREHDDLFTLNALAQVIEDSGEDLDVILALFEVLDGSETVENIIERIETQDYIAYTEVDGLGDVAYEMARERGTLDALERMPSLIPGVSMASYIDWDAIGDDMRHYGWVYNPTYRVAICVD